jgi:uroporphyrinogen-III decarboxylase
VVYVDAWAGGFLQMLGVCSWASLEAGLCALIRDPARIEEIVDQTTDFYCLCLDRLLARARVDYATFYEPIASNTGPVVSPAHFDRFVLPGYRKVMALLDRHGVPLRVLCTTGGDLTALLPGLIDSGINALWISNIQSTSMSYAELRRVLGPEIALVGGIDATSLARDEEAVRRAVEETVPHLLEQGRYLPCLDDRPRSNVSFERYGYYRGLLAAMAQKG